MSLCKPLIQLTEVFMLHNLTSVKGTNISTHCYLINLQLVDLVYYQLYTSTMDEHTTYYKGTL